MSDTDTENTVEIHECSNGDLQVNKDALPEQGRCRVCGRVWTKVADRNTWYDPTEGTDPSAPDEADAAAQMAWADRQFYGHA